MNALRVVLVGCLVVLSACPAVSPADSDGGSSTGGGTAATGGGSGATGGGTGATGGGTATSGGGAQSSGAALQFDVANYAFDPLTTGGAAGSHTFTLSNVGGTATGALTVTVTGEGFTVGTKTCGAALAAAQTCTVDVSFAPTTIGTRNGRLTVGDGGSASASVLLVGTSLAPAALSVVGTATDFGAVLVGASVTKSFTVTNTGESAVAMLASSFTGAQAAAFEVVTPSGTDCTVGGMLAAGATCTLQVKLTPTAGVQRAVLHVAGTPGGEALLALQGLGLRPALLTSTASTHDFGEVEGNVPSPGFVWVLTNEGDVATGTLGVTLANSLAKSSDSCSGQLLAPGSSCSMTLTITPFPGASTADATITGTPGGSVTLSTSATGMARLTISASNGGRVRMTDGRLDCGSNTCTGLFAFGIFVGLEAVNTNGSNVHFTNWAAVNDPLNYARDCLADSSSRQCGFGLYASVNMRAEFKRTEGNLIFVSSVPVAMNEGIAAYDQRCNTLATAAGLNSSAGSAFVAWVSTPSLPLNSRWTATGGLELVDGRVFAASRADVFAGLVVNPLVQTEDGFHLPVTNIFTGTNGDGSAATQNCLSWTSALPADLALVGTWGVGGTAWSGSFTADCSDPTMHIACVQNTTNALLTNAPIPSGGKLIYRTALVARPLNRAAADAVCAANKPPTFSTRNFVALLATVGTSAGSRLDAAAQYYRVDGAPMGTGDELKTFKAHTGVWTLPNGALQAAPAAIWSGADTLVALGTNASTCNDWTSSTGTVTLASSQGGGPSIFGGGPGPGCSGTAALICVEP